MDFGVLYVRLNAFAYILEISELDYNYLFNFEKFVIVYFVLNFLLAH